MPSKSKKLEREEEDVSWFDEHEFSLALLCFIGFFAIILIIFYHPIQKTTSLICGDGSSYSSCSIVKPYYCDNNGSLNEKASVCGCGSNDTVNGNTCFNSLQTQPKIISLSYILDGQPKEINYTVYGGLANHLFKTSQVVSYQNGAQPQRSDFIFNKINQTDQAEFILSLVVEIQNITNDKIQQARIAISLVQSIPYGQSNATSNFFGTPVNYSRYPYQVLYDNQGICGEKSELLAFLLRGLGFDTSIFYFSQENHEAVGIKCPIENSYMNTGYCFVETTGPSIISDSSVPYVGGISLSSKPQLILVSTGDSLPAGLPEYSDAQTLKNIRDGSFMLFRNSNFNRLVEKYGLINEYQIA